MRLYKSMALALISSLLLLTSCANVSDDTAKITDTQITTETAVSTENEKTQTPTNLPETTEPATPSATDTGETKVPSTGEVPPTSASITETPEKTEWQIKFADKFSEGVVITDNSYTSPNISLTIGTFTNSDNTCVYHVADIYISSIECLQRYLVDIYDGKTESSIDYITAFEQSGAIFLASGDVYGNTKLMSLTVANGEVILDRAFSNQDVFLMFNDGSMMGVSGNGFDLDDYASRGVYQAFAFGPSLLDENGIAKTSFSSYSRNLEGANPRNCIGYFEPGHYCFVAVDGRSDISDGMTMQELAKLMESLGCMAAYNLDGGRSAGMVYAGEYVNVNNWREGCDFVILKEPD